MCIDSERVEISALSSPFLYLRLDFLVRDLTTLVRWSGTASWLADGEPGSGCRGLILRM